MEGKTPPVCDSCGNFIRGSMWTTVQGEPRVYHLSCKPVLVFLHGRDTSKDQQYLGQLRRVFDTV